MDKYEDIKRIETDYTDDRKEDFSEIIYSRLKKLGEEKNDAITREEFSKRMGVKWDSLYRIITKTRPTPSRDFIIAICSQLAMDAFDTDEALYFYGFPVLNTNDENSAKKYNKRDHVLIDILEANEKENNTELNVTYSIDDINVALKEKGLDELYLPLRKKMKTQKLDYYVKKEFVDLIVDDFAYTLPLEQEYDINAYRIKNSMLIEISDTKENKILEYHSNGRCYIHDYNVEKELSTIKTYRNISELDSYKEAFKIMRIKNNKAYKKINKQIDDTKNYKDRISAKYNDLSIKVFMETFNPYRPELNEYYFVEYKDGNFCYSISTKSQFMYNKLGKESYLEIYDKYDPHVIAKGNSINGLIQSYRTSSSMVAIGPSHIRKLEVEMKNIENEIKTFISKIKNKKIFIRNVDLIIDDENLYYYLCCYFGLEEYFKFKKEKNDFIDFFTPLNQEVEYKDITISLSDLHSAFELGLNTVDDIYNVKCNYGEIEVLLESL